MRGRLLILAALVLAAFAPAATADATDYVVNSTADEADNTPADGVCDANSGCTLRAAITNVNQNAVASDTITILASATPYTLTITGPAGDNTNGSGDLDIQQDVVITGAGPGATVVSGNDIDRVFDILDSAANVTISGMTITDGNPPATAGGDGGGIRAAAA